MAQIPLGVFRLPYPQKITWNPASEVTYILGITGYSFGIAVPTDSPIKTWADFVALPGAERAPKNSLHDTFKKAMEMPHHIEMMGRFDRELLYMSPEQYKKFVEDTIVREKAVIQRLKATGKLTGSAARAPQACDTPGPPGPLPAWGEKPWTVASSRYRVCC